MINLIAALAAAWIVGSPMPVPRTEVSAAPLGQEIVVVGGFLALGREQPPRRRVPPADDTLAAAARPARLGRPRRRRVAGAGRVVIVGGYGADRAPLRAAFLFDGARWRRLPAPPEPRAAAAAAALPGRTRRRRRRRHGRSASPARPSSST